MSAPLVFFILGTVDSGRREIVADLMANSLGDTDRPLLVTAQNEPELSGVAQARMQGVAGFRAAQWSWHENSPVRFAPIEIGDATAIFIVADGKRDPVDHMEALHEWLPGSGAELGRIIAVIHCRLGFEHSQLRRWHEACVHFADVVLLNRREGVPNQWVGDFKAWLQKERYPCLVEFVKKSEVANPALLLEPKARRMSLYFDEADEWPDEEDLAEGETIDGDDLLGAVDPYIERFRSGRRARELPDIKKILGS